MQFIYIKPKEILTRLQLYSSCYNSFFFFLLNPYDKNFERSRKNKKKKKGLNYHGVSCFRKIVWIFTNVIIGGKSLFARKKKMAGCGCAEHISYFNSISFYGGYSWYTTIHNNSWYMLSFRSEKEFNSTTRYV